MAIYCSQCGKQHPDDANFCMGCGKPFKAGTQSSSMRWEYKDLKVPLNIKESKGTSVIPRINDIVLKAIQREGQDGWQAEGSTDYSSLWDRGAFETTSRENFMQTKVLDFTYVAVTIRLKRLSAK